MLFRSASANMAEDEYIIDVQVGQDFFLALSNKGKVYAWGDNYNHQLGDGSATYHSTPVPVTGLPENQQIIAIAAGGRFSVALTGDGEVYTWGLNGSGQLGIGTTGASSSKAVRVLGNEGNGYLEDIIYITAGSAHAVAIRVDGTLFAWGDNSTGQLGNEKKGVGGEIGRAHV